jgi:hypothetical protein
MDKSLYIRKNVGPVDQFIRLVLGFALVILPAYFGASTWIIAILAAIGGAQIIEGIIAY